MAEVGPPEGKVYFFGGDATHTMDVTRDEVGSKAMNLIRMARLGLPVPPGFVLSTHFCSDYFERKRRLTKGFPELLESNIRRLENMMGQTFGGSRRPLLVSVRSGAAVSMPGMMETILNIGLCDATLRGIVRMTGNPRLSWDSYRRLIQSLAEVVHGVPHDAFEDMLEEYLAEEEVPHAGELDSKALSDLTQDYLNLFMTLTGQEFPQRPIDQLVQAVEAVFRSWDSPRAVEFRRLHDIKGLRGTAVIIQNMVFGNMGGNSGSGVAFTRDPATGENKLYMDFLFNAQGEDVVSGRSTVGGLEELHRVLPGVHREIHRIRKLLETEFRDVQDFEFTVQDGRLFILQSRTAKRTDWAALRIATDLVKEGLVTPKEGLALLKGLDLKKVERVRLASKSKSEPIASAIPASPGVAVGEIALDPDIAQERAGEGVPVILVREDTSTTDIAGMAVAVGILTAVGGRTSHAAVVARQLNRVCLVGCSTLNIDIERRACTFGDASFKEGDHISLDGNTGNIYAGRMEVVVDRPKKTLAEVQGWR